MKSDEEIYYRRSGDKCGKLSRRASIVLQRLGIKPLVEETFRLADGSKIVRKKGGALFRYGDRVRLADLIFGQEDDSMLLGALTLQSLGLALDPLKRELKPIPLILGGKLSSEG